MPIPHAVSRFNKHVTNPIQRLWAPRLAPYALIEHVGRRSGTTYQTPVVGLVERDKLSVPLLYGADSDWVRNVRAAGRARVTRGGQHFQLVGIRVIPADSYDLPRAIRWGTSRVAPEALYGTLIPAS